MGFCISHEREHRPQRNLTDIETGAMQEIKIRTKVM